MFFKGAAYQTPFKAGDDEGGGMQDAMGTLLWIQS